MRRHAHCLGQIRGTDAPVLARQADSVGNCSVSDVKCAVSLNLMHRRHKVKEVKDHVLGMARSVPLRQMYKMKWSRHRVVARKMYKKLVDESQPFDLNLMESGHCIPTTSASLPVPNYSTHSSLPKHSCFSHTTCSTQ
jgi:hypothetical protein